VHQSLVVRFCCSFSIFVVVLFRNSLLSVDRNMSRHTFEPNPIQQLTAADEGDRQTLRGEAVPTNYTNLSSLSGPYNSLSHEELLEIIKNKELAIKSRDIEYQLLSGRLEMLQNEYEVHNTTVTIIMASYMYFHQGKR
jgi:hypothetical protein